MSSVAAMSDTVAFKFDLDFTSAKMITSFHLQHEMVNGVAFIPLVKRSALGKLSGHWVGGKYFSDVNLFAYLEERHNDMITELLQKSITEEDIGADVDTTSVPLGSERATLFKSIRSHQSLH